MTDSSRNLRDTTLRQLRALAEVADSGSYTAAAAALGVTQPAVTLALQTLHERIGLVLLERLDGRLRLTDAGRELRVLHGQIDAALTETGRRLAAMRGGRGGSVAIGAVSTAKYFVPFIIAEFQRLHPGIVVRLAIGNREEVVARLAGNELDLAITGRPPDDLLLDRQLLGDHPNVIIAAPAHRLALKRRITLAQLAGENFLVREKGSGTRILMERFFSEGSFDAHIGMEISSNETIKQAVMASLGIAFISAHVIAGEIADGRLRILNVEGLPLTRQWFVVRRSGRALLPAAQLMYEFLGREAKRFLPGAAVQASAAGGRKTNAGGRAKP